MSPVEFKKRCRPDDFKGRGPYMSSATPVLLTNRDYLCVKGRHQNLPRPDADGCY